ncbi:N-myristoyltransferase (nucleomorph) [Cryptomonas paramecium]|uniref:glycylpeptide N-tetradecanoyltransferase n=1 Tax=Cryptomonas paramaecium TaxID=2898 RepID=F2HI85_9CRYP|nr:N-myristoyltransferase [Cryptomonas paramecium]AEA39009.1 N-myristoyltransferase [Cryptomonas paramecium]|mmetsp:Transcript_36645/g.96592  ORF Transcript_36645/g.96592 Transcript_36645/m.96592 type:complete len:339 (-) Transcript_36645:12129-13145(-)
MFLLPYQFKWVDLDLTEITELEKLLSFLNFNYIRDDKIGLSFDYTHDCLALETKSPVWTKCLCIKLEYRRGKKIISSILSTLKQMTIGKKILCISEINFLCSTKRLRKKRFVEIIIKEIKRRLNSIGIYKSMYFTRINLPESTYFHNCYHYAINYHKLKTSKFFNKSSFAQKKYKYKKKYKFSKKPRKQKYTELRKGFFFYKAYKYVSKNYYFHWLTSPPGLTYIISMNKLNSKHIKQTFIFYFLPTRYMNKRSLFLYRAFFFLFHKKNIFFKSRIWSAIQLVKKIGLDILDFFSSKWENIGLSSINFQQGTGRLNFYFFNYKYDEKTSLYENGLDFF